MGQLARQSEVEDLGPALWCHHDVGGLEITVHDSRSMRVIQSVGYLDAVAQHLLGRKPAPGNHLTECAARDVLHRDEVLPLGLADFVDGADVGVVDGGGRARLLQQLVPRLGIVGESPTEELDGDRPLQLSVEGAIDLTHAAGTDLLDDRVVSERLADHGRPPNTLEMFNLGTPSGARQGARRRGAPEAKLR
jgi:hypothetical protein